MGLEIDAVRAWPNAVLMAVTTNESPALTAYPGWSSTRERGRLARILIPATSLPSAATPLQSAPNPPLRGSLPSCQVLCGRDARAPRWSLLLPPARPLAGPSRASSNPLVSLCSPSWPFVDNSFPLFALRGYLLPPSRPLAAPYRASSNPLVSLRRSSWPFVDIFFLSLRVSSRIPSCPSWIPFVDIYFYPFVALPG